MNEYIILRNGGKPRRYYRQRGLGTYIMGIDGSVAIMLWLEKKNTPLQKIRTKGV